MKKEMYGHPDPTRATRVAESFLKGTSDSAHSQGSETSPTKCFRIQRQLPQSLRTVIAHHCHQKEKLEPAFGSGFAQSRDVGPSRPGEMGRAWRGGGWLDSTVLQELRVQKPAERLQCRWRNLNTQSAHCSCLLEVISNRMQLMTGECQTAQNHNQSKRSGAMGEPVPLQQDPQCDVRNIRRTSHSARPDPWLVSR